MTLRPLALALGLSSAALATPTFAEDPAPPKETRFFEEFDKDLDGKVTLAELTGGQGDAASFALLDRNKDGAITPDELGLPADFKPKPRPPQAPGTGGERPGQPGQPGQPGGDGRGADVRKKFREMDKNGDGKVTREEWTGAPEGFDRYDRNKDGALDAADFGKGGPGGPGGPGGAGGKPGMPGGKPFDPEQVKARWKAMDKDADGKVSREEYTGDMEFERVDRDKDGYLTDADLKGMRGPGQPPSPEELARRFTELDKDRSGQLEAAELEGLPEPQRERLRKGDVNGDGTLSKEEFLEGAKKAMRPPEPGGVPGAKPGDGGPGSREGGAREGGLELLRRFDHDRDGKVTRDQFPGNDEHFAKLDRDGDGVLTEKDFPAAAPAAPVAPPTASGNLVAELDRDGDGRLTRAEFKGQDDEWRRLDRNQDGWITPDELAAK